jgi:ABC-type multidrug transport system ATPase subunit
VQPTDGRVKHGKTVKIATLTQGVEKLAEHLDEPVRVVLSRLATTYTFGSGSKSQELTPSQLLERLGFVGAQLSTPVKDLSGGQQRRLQLLLILLEQPNVMILDEPTNDLDTDMLAAMEDLLDSWPGTLIVVSHDRYFLERVTDQQYGILGGHLRHLPGGVDEYLRLRTAHAATTGPAAPKQAVQSGASVSGADLRATQKEISAIERKLTKLDGQIKDAQRRQAAHDQGDYEGLRALTAALGELESEVATLEERWLDLSEALG